MRCIANYEVESEVSVVSDDMRLELNHPKGAFQARISNIVRADYSTPFLLSIQIIFEAPTLQDSRDIVEDKLAECLSMLAFITGAGFKRHRIKQIVDCTPASGMRECLIWADSVEHEDPSPFLDHDIAASIERLLQFDPPPAVRRALRWYRIGIHARVPEDQFQYFWFALEILAEYQKALDKVPNRCPKCKSPLYCETCKTHPSHRPYIKQAIRALIQAVEKDCDEKIVETLDRTRNALMHGATLKDITAHLAKCHEDIVDVLGKVLFKALLCQFPAELLQEPIKFGSPNTYVHRRMTGIAHVSTVVPTGDDGELDLDKFTGLKVSMVTDNPPQSGRPSVIVMNREQHKQLGLLTREAGDHQGLCKRVYERVKMHDGKIIALVLSTDMTRIRDVLARGETGKWQNLFRDILVLLGTATNGGSLRSK